MNVTHLNRTLSAKERVIAINAFRNSHTPAVLLSTYQLRGTGFNFIEAIHVVLAQKSWTMNEQWQAIARIH